MDRPVEAHSVDSEPALRAPDGSYIDWHPGVWPFSSMYSRSQLKPSSH